MDGIPYSRPTDPRIRRCPAWTSLRALLMFSATLLPLPAMAQSDGYREAAVAEGCYLEMNEAGDTETWLALTGHGQAIVLHELEYDRGMAADLPGVGWHGIASRGLRWVGDRFSGPDTEGVGFYDATTAWRTDRFGVTSYLYRVPLVGNEPRVTWTEWRPCGDGCQRPVTQTGDTVQGHECAWLLERIDESRIDWGPSARFDVDPIADRTSFVIAPYLEPALLLTAGPGWSARITHVSSATRRTTEFRLVPGLAGTDYSFESVSFPGHYLRHASFTLYLDSNDGTDLFRQDATFRVQGGWNGAAEGATFVSVNFPDRAIVHVGSEFHLLTGAEMASAHHATFRFLVP